VPPVSIPSGRAFDAWLARKRTSDLSAIGKVLSATEDLIFELDDSAMNKQMRLKFALRTALSLCPTLF
jgi:hypothetical protein